MENNHECIICGNGYYACNKCDKINSWRRYVDTPSCYQLYLILKYIFPEAEAYYNCDHVITKIKNVYYDINGIVDNISNYLPIDEIYVKDIRKEAIN